MTRPSAKQIAREFKGGKTMLELALDHDLWHAEVEAAIRKYVKPGGSNGT